MKIRVFEQAKFLIERQFIKGAHYQLLFVAGLIGLISIVGGLLVYNSENLENLDESIWWAFLRLTDPGYLGDDQGVWKRLISTIITVAGYVLFLGSLVAIITTWLNRKIADLEKGYTPVAANNHLVILGWTNRTMHIAGELFQSQGRVKRFLRFHNTRKLKLIILSEEVGHKLLNELKENKNIGKKAGNIILRSGNAIDREHLRRVDILNASTIIIPSYATSTDELLTPDVETIKTLLSINAEAEMNNYAKLPFVVAEIQDENKIKAAARAYKGPLEIISSDTIISRLISQNIRHSGLNEIYNELLAKSVKTDLFTRHFPEFTGKSIREVKKYLSKAIVVGIVKIKKEKFIPKLNVAEDYILKEKDRLVLLADEFAQTAPDKVPSLDSNSLIEPTASIKPKNRSVTGIEKRILILGWNHKIPALIKEFSNYHDDKYYVDIVSIRPAFLREKALALIGIPTSNVQCRQIEADYVKEAEIKIIEPGQYDHIILVSTDKLEEDEEADARTIVGYILLEEILAHSKKQPNILIELADPSNQSMMKRFKRDVIVSPMILSHMLTQVALQREMYYIYNQLFTVGGPEITFKKPAVYGITQNRVSFHEVEQYATAMQETAIGIYLANSELASDDFHLLNPPRNYQLDLSKDYYIIALTSIN